MARNAADLVLLDDDFATIIVAIEHGRATYSNIRRSSALFRAFALLGPVEVMFQTTAFTLVLLPGGWRPGGALPEPVLLAAAPGLAFTAVVPSRRWSSRASWSPARSTSTCAGACAAGPTIRSSRPTSGGPGADPAVLHRGAARGPG